MDEFTSDLRIFWHDDVLLHDTGTGVWEGKGSDLLGDLELHPENDLRVRNMRSILEKGPLKDRVRWDEGRHATPAELETVHRPDYVSWVKSTAEAGGRRLDDESTVISAQSWRAATAAAGTAIEAVDAVLSGEAKTAFALVRPPGHHAQPGRADGYCLFNNAALMAERARRAGVEKVAIVDWDVHHGNGTQACFYERPDVLTVSLHMRTGLWGESHPQTGSPAELGVGPGQGFNINVELPIGSGDQTYEAAMAAVVTPILEQYEPGLIIGAIGQDASTFDANGRQNLSMQGFRTMGRQLAAAAEELCDGRIALVQEGGYARTYAAFCLHATLEGILGVEEPALEEVLAYIPDDYRRAREAVEDVQTPLSTYWSLPLGLSGQRRTP